MPLTASGCSAHRPPCPCTPKASASPTTQATHASPWAATRAAAQGRGR